MRSSNNPAPYSNRPELGQAFHWIAGTQREWARDHGVVCDHRSRVRELDANLFQPLRADTRREFESADGNELADKLYALHSSAALAVNVFQFWRNRTGVIGSCLGLTDCTGLRFERRLPLFDGIVPGYASRAGTKTPNVDVELSGPGGAIAIECKFTEPFVRYPELRSPFTSTYFMAEAARVWDGFAATRALAVGLNSGTRSFHRLDAPQLIKTSLACQRQYGPGSWRFLYLWYKPPVDDAVAAECAELQAELDEFQELTNGEIPLDPLCWQNLFGYLQKACDDQEHAYCTWLGKRYFHD